MLYPKSNNDRLDKELFRNPTSEYRAAPFWAWNCKLEKDQLLRQIEHLKEMGMGGYHIHARNGLLTEYMGDEFMDMVKACNEKGKQEKMLTWLYDEDRYPSGSAGGRVTKNRDYSERYILFTPYAYGNVPKEKDLGIMFSKPRQETGELLARYLIKLNDDGYLTDYRRLSDGENPIGTIWYAYVETAPPYSWFNMETYVDTMNKQAIEKFVEITYDKYYNEVGKDFGESIPAIFTDEPQMVGKGRLDFSNSEKDITMPYTNDFPETFKKEYGYDALDKLPELYWELKGDEISSFRYHYNMHVSDRFYDAFFETIGSWCKKHNILFTGHLMSEQSLQGQYLRLGEAMRQYDAFGLSGIDMLCDHHEYTTAKQAQSVVHQKGSQGMLSELDGVTNWDYDFRGHKLQGDWQAALGVTVRVPHLAWVSMEGEAKRDYPASIGYQSPWYKEYNIVEDHFARVATALTRGEPDVKVAVIHPIESYWICSGPSDKTYDTCTELDDNFHNLCEWLITGQIDFNYISECLLPTQCEKGNAPLAVGEMKYEAVIVADCRTIRSTTLDRLESFVEAGGTLLFTGEVPKLVDAMPSNRAIELADKAGVIPFSKTSLVNALDDMRVVDIRGAQGNRTDNMMYQMRSEGDSKWLFICHSKNPENQDITPEEKLTITIDGIWSAELYDTITGEMHTVNCKHAEEKTKISRGIYAHDSLLIRLSPIVEEEAPSIIEADYKSLSDIDIPSSVPIKLSEPNVLLLDIAEYAFDDGQWQKSDEILRIDSKFRKEIGYPRRGGRLVQPYILPEQSKEDHFLRLRFKIKSEIDVLEPCLALEHPEVAEIKLNGKAASTETVGWFVDEAIKKVKLPPVLKGENVLEVKVLISERIGAEWCYLLGDFGVKVAGSSCTIIEPERELSFGDWTHQGLPFYAGNVTYCIEVEANDLIEIEATHFRNPVIRVDMDGKKQGLIAFAPYKLNIPTTAGKHTLEITAYGNRYNAFSCIHNSDNSEFFFGPSTWRTEGLAWSYEYRLKQIGILVKPSIRV